MVRVIFREISLKIHLCYAPSPKPGNVGTSSGSLRRLLTVSVAAYAAGRPKIANTINKKKLWSGDKYRRSIVLFLLKW